MPDIRFKRSSGSVPPATLGPGEPAWVDGLNTLYIGKTGGGIRAIAGDGAGFVHSGQITVTASEAIPAGSLINFHGNSQMRLANAATGIRADGFVRAAVASGAQGVAFSLSGMDFVPLVEGGAALVGGSDYFLSAVAAGRISITPVEAGNGFIHQRVGKPAGSVFLFRPSEPVLRS